MYLGNISLIISQNINGIVTINLHNHYKPIENVYLIPKLQKILFFNITSVPDVYPNIQRKFIKIKSITIYMKNRLK